MTQPRRSSLPASLCAIFALGAMTAATNGCADRVKQEGETSASAPLMAKSATIESAASAAAMPASAGDLSQMKGRVGGTTDTGEAAAPDAAPPPPAALPRKIIYTATVNLVTEKLSDAARKLAEAVKAHGGYIAETNISGAAGAQRTATWKLRVPVPQFDALMASLGNLGELQDSATTSQDVSEEFYDVAARLKNKKVEEARLLEHLQKSTGRLTEILAVERELSRVREEIERMEGRLRFLSNQSDLSTVTVTIREIKDYVPPAPPTFATEIARTFSGSVHALTVTVKAFILMLVGFVPWAIPLGLLIAGILYWERSNRQRRKITAAALLNRDRSSSEYDSRSEP